MPTIAHQNREQTEQPSLRSFRKGPTRPFQGFAPPTSNTTFTPNQFFDVCIPHYSRGVVRLVAYMIRKTLGWCDADGNPQQEQVLIPYQDLVARAGISHEMIRRALDEAIAGNFIRCLKPGRAKASGDAGQTALYELRWSQETEYVKDPKKFQGFFEDEGNRTDIPNEFFDRVVPSESLTVIKAVGSIVRFSIGFQARHGRRRQQVRLSYRDIQRYAHLRSRTSLSGALQAALRRNYIVCLEEGVFDPNAGRLSRAATYALKWSDSSLLPAVAVPANDHKAAALAGDHRSEIRTGDQSEKWTGNGQKSGHGHRSENWTGIEMKQRNDTYKQQGAVADLESKESLELLRRQGYGGRTARTLASRYPREAIEKQIAWLSLRLPKRNPLGLLRLAIEENWPEPKPLRTTGDAHKVLGDRPLSAPDPDLRAQRQAHEQACREGWFDYLEAQEKRLKEEVPDALDRFEAHRDRERQRVAGLPWTKGQTGALDRFDSREHRLQDLQTFFAPRILDFLAWNDQARLRPVFSISNTP